MTARRTASRVAATITALFLALVSGLVTSPADAAPVIERVGTLAIERDAGVVADEPTGSLITIEGGVTTPLALGRFDAKSLKRSAHASFDSWWPQAGSGGRARVFAFDAAARRLLLLAYASAATKDNTALPSLLAIDADRFEIRSTLPLATVAPPGMRIVGMRARPRNRILLLMQAVPSVTVPFLPPLESPRMAGVTLVEVDATSGATTWGPVVVRGCQSAVTNLVQSDPAVSGGSVFVGCGTAQTFTTNAPGVSAIAAVELADPSSQRLVFLPGSYGTGDLYFDEPGGRLLLVSSAAGRPNQAVWIFDLAHRTFVGQVASGEVNVLGAGLDPTIGRMYVGIDGALLVASDRGAEIAQAASFDVDVNVGPIVPIPFARLVVVPLRGPGGSWITAVYRDNLAADAFSAGTLVDPVVLDRLTSDAPQFSSDAQALGARVHVIGGVNSAGQNAVAFGGSYWTQAGLLTGLKDGDRDVTMARVLRAHLADGEASAESIAAEPDSNTSSDYATLSQKSGGAFAPDWPYAPAGCRDFGDGAEPDEGEEASALCDLSAGRVDATASFRGVGEDPLIAVGSSFTRTRIERSPAGIVEAVVHAEARDVVLGGTVTIGIAISDVTVRAGGRPGTAAASYRRSFRNVTIGETSVCDASCDPAQVATAITDALGTQVRVELPAADVRATAGGAHGRAVREPWQHQQDVVLNNQDPTQQQIPALRVVFVNDATLASRVIVELAAANADVTVVRTVTAAATPDEAPVAAADPPPAPPESFEPGAAPTATPPTATPPAGDRVVRVLGHGWRIFATGGPAALARAVGLWTLLSSPVFFAVRRRWLVRLRGGAA